MRQLFITCFYLLINLTCKGQVNYYCNIDNESKIGTFMAIDMNDETKSLLKFYDIKNSIESYIDDFKKQELLKSHNSSTGSLPNTKSIICYHSFYGEFGLMKAFMFFDYQIENDKIILYFDKENSEYLLKIPRKIILKKI